MLIKSLITALGRFPEYRAHIVGTNMETISDELHRRPSEQIVLEGFRPHADLLRLLMQSQIFFLPSRSESFNIAAAEALCCGCSVVAPTHIPTANWFCGYESGTVANKYAVGGLADSLTTEMRLWMSGRRDPFAIAERWMEEVGVRQCAQRLLGAMGIPNETSPSACC
jgi:glycosyltransferase involved in cell wall biosynthesis